MNRDRLNRIRRDHERAVTLLGYDQLPTNREMITLIHDMTDLLTEHTNSHRGHQ